MTVVFLPLSALLTHTPFSRIGAQLKDGVECYLLGLSDGSPKGEGCPEAAKLWYAAIVFALMFNLAMPICTKLAGATMMWFVRAMAIPLCGMMFASKIIMGDHADPPNRNQAVGLALVATGIFIYN